MEEAGQEVGQGAGWRDRARIRQWVLGAVLVAIAVPFGIHAYLQWRDARDEEAAASSYNEFVASMMQADAIADPLQRCLQYPALPGSHWNAETTKAYCVFRNHKTLTLAEIDTLVQQGRAAEVDRAFRGYFDEQKRDVGKPGLLGVSFHTAGFHNSSPHARSVIDAWKQQSPDSAFAHAASAVQYVDSAQQARGFGWARDLSDEQVNGMRHQLELARQDMDRAITLMPDMVGIHGTMLFLGELSGDDDYIEQAVVQGLKADPYSFELRIQMMNLSQPKWGSMFGGELRQRAEDEAGAVHNPLLRLVAGEPAAFRALCDCGYSAAQARELVVAAAGSNLTSGELVDLVYPVYGTDPRLAVEIYAEALRYEPDNVNALQWRSQQMIKLGDKDGAIKTIAAASKRFPQNYAIETQLANILWQSGRIADAVQTYEDVLQHDPDNQLAMGQLGDLYNHEAQQPNKAAALGEALIARHPENGAGYIIRACNEMDHNLPGRYDTIHYFLDRFGSMSEYKQPADQMRAYLLKHPEPPRV